MFEALAHDLDAGADFDAADPRDDLSPPPQTWTPDHVGRRLVEAMGTLDRMPRPRGPRAPGNHWPRHRLEWADQIAQSELPEPERRERAGARLAELAQRPSGAAIDRMDRALEWLRALRLADPELALMVTLWADRLARGRSIRQLCRERGWSPQTFHNRRARGLAAISATLQRRDEPVL